MVEIPIRGVRATMAFIIKENDKKMFGPKKNLNPRKIKLIIFINFFLNIFGRHLESFKKKIREID